MGFRLQLLFLLMIISSSIHGQRINSMDLGSISVEMMKEQRPVAIFMYTSWCKFCKHMEASTFLDENVGTLLKESFYFARLDGESEETIDFMGQIFPPGERTHTLARALSDPEAGPTFPSFVLLNPKMEITFRHEGYLAKDELKQVLVKTLAYSVDE